MSIRVKNKSTNQATLGGESTEVVDSSFDQRETTVDGQSFHWGPNQVRNFLDQGVGAAHAAFKGGATIIQEDAVPFGSSRS